MIITSVLLTSLPSSKISLWIIPTNKFRENYEINDKKLFQFLNKTFFPSTVIENPCSKNVQKYTRANYCYSMPYPSYIWIILNR